MRDDENLEQFLYYFAEALQRMSPLDFMDLSLACAMAAATTFDANDGFDRFLDASLKPVELGE